MILRSSSHQPLKLPTRKATTQFLFLHKSKVCDKQRERFGIIKNDAYRDFFNLSLKSRLFVLDYWSTNTIGVWLKKLLISWSGFETKLIWMSGLVWFEPELKPNRPLRAFSIPLYSGDALGRCIHSHQGRLSKQDDIWVSFISSFSSL